MEEKILVKTRKNSLFSAIVTWFGITFIGSLFYIFVLAPFNRVGTLPSPLLWIHFREFPTICARGILIMSVPSLAITIFIRKSALTLTDKRAYGVTMFGKRVDLPLDSISAVATGMFKSLTISTASGRISFWGIQNLGEFHSELSKLIVERQNYNGATTQGSQQSNADDLKKYKELLDSGAITLEEFEAKKKQLLDL